jgi:hypothetical protein
MQLAAFASRSGFPAAGSATQSERSGTKNYGRLIILVFALNVISAALFILLVNRPVYDDIYNTFDVHTYATQGVSLATVRANRNPPGPVSFIWMAAAVRLFGGDELLDARAAILFSWVLLVIGMLIGARKSNFPQMWYGALLASLVFPHSVEATALVLTEGPALLFATLGAWAWIEFASGRDATPSTSLLGIMGGLLMGIAVTCRQYYLAMLPAALLIAIFQFRAGDNKRRWMWLASVFTSLVAAVIPVLLLVLTWKGLSSPGIASGLSYPMYRAAVGLNISRPILAAFSTAFYLLPLTFPTMWRVKAEHRWPALVAAILGGIAAGSLSSSMLQPGPLHTLVHVLAPTQNPEHIVFGFIAAVTIYNAIAIGLMLWDKWSMVASCPPLAFALLTVVFFVGEQAGVGGNILFYDRYVLQVAPFLGIIAFSLIPRLTYARLVTLAALSAVSHVMLWRFAFGT